MGPIMQINESLKDGDIPMEPKSDEDKIAIFLSKNDFADTRCSATGQAHRSAAAPLPPQLIAIVPGWRFSASCSCTADAGSPYAGYGVRLCFRRLRSRGSVKRPCGHPGFRTGFQNSEDSGLGAKSIGIEASVGPAGVGGAVDELVGAEGRTSPRVGSETGHQPHDSGHA